MKTFIMIYLCVVIIHLMISYYAAYKEKCIRNRKRNIFFAKYEVRYGKIIIESIFFRSQLLK